MSKSYECQYYKCIIVFSFLLHLTTTYRAVSLDDERVCINSRTGEVKLGPDITSAVIVSLGKLKKPTSAREKTFTCKFEVHSSKSVNDGLFAVIQQMVFRKNETTGDCIDYVQYETNNYQYSKKYCGRLSANLGMSPIFRSPDFTHTTVMPTINSYVDPSARLTVHIYLDKDYPQAWDELELEIAFTSFKYCVPFLEHFKPCSAKFKERCIYETFFNDGIINCPYPDCVDETRCSESIQNENVVYASNNELERNLTSVDQNNAFMKICTEALTKYININEYDALKNISIAAKLQKMNNAQTVEIAEKKSVGNKVIIGSVSLLLVIFLLFVCFVWMCRKYRKLCWAEEFAQSNSRTIELNEPPMRDVPISSSQNVASGLGLPPTEEDKDLPPSYESLFPNR